MVADFRKHLDVTVNPRYGVLEDGELVPRAAASSTSCKDDAAAAAASGCEPPAAPPRK